MLIVAGKQYKILLVSSTKGIVPVFLKNTKEGLNEFGTQYKLNLYLVKIGRAHV
jgi:hypothetical protein